MWSLQFCIVASLAYRKRRKTLTKASDARGPVVSWNATKECVSLLVDPHRANLVKNDQVSGALQQDLYRQKRRGNGGQRLFSNVAKVGQPREKTGNRPLEWAV